MASSISPAPTTTGSVAINDEPADLVDVPVCGQPSPDAPVRHPESKHPENPLRPASDRRVGASPAPVPAGAAQ